VINRELKKWRARYAPAIVLLIALFTELVLELLGVCTWSHRRPNPQWSQSGTA
jgi:hypothetical protein